jgi:hypothetical protein
LYDEEKSAITYLEVKGLHCLYRLYEDLCADYFVIIGYECAYFVYQPHGRWSLAKLPDPKDDDLVRYSIPASMNSESECSPHKLFLKRNIKAPMGYLYTL